MRVFWLYVITSVLRKGVVSGRGLIRADESKFVIFSFICIWWVCVVMQNTDGLTYLTRLIKFRHKVFPKCLLNVSTQWMHIHLIALSILSSVLAMLIMICLRRS